MTYHNDDYGVKGEPVAVHTESKGRKRNQKQPPKKRLHYAILMAPVAIAVIVAGVQIIPSKQSFGGVFNSQEQLAFYENIRIQNQEKIDNRISEGFKRIRVRGEYESEVARIEAERIEAERAEAERVEMEKQIAEQEEAERLRAQQEKQQQLLSQLPTPAATQPDFATEPAMEIAPRPTETGGGYSGLPSDSYWDRMAMCETGGNWAHFPYGTWTGGLGIYNQTWLGWGGGEFAPTAGQATREQQIIVANRIATQGYGNLGPVGYSAWGCLSTVGYP
jgi:hypothetical protein